MRVTSVASPPSPTKMTNYPVVRHLFPLISHKQHAQGALVITRFRCSLALIRQAHALRSFGQPIYIEASGLRVIQVPHGLSCLPSQKWLSSISGNRVRWLEGFLLVEAVVDEAEVAVVGAGADGADHVELGVARFARQFARTLDELLAKATVLRTRSALVQA